FFSSRRRHTRSYGDWSSDVCSSDLDLTAAATGHIKAFAVAGAFALAGAAEKGTGAAGAGAGAGTGNRIDTDVTAVLRSSTVDAKIGRASCRERVWSAVEAVAGKRE